MVRGQPCVKYPVILGDSFRAEVLVFNKFNFKVVSYVVLWPILFEKLHYIINKKSY